MIDGLTDRKRANILEKAIMLLTDTGTKIHSVTFDSTAVNITMDKYLGVDLSSKPYIINTSTNELIYVIVDAAHMIKFLKNAWGNKNIKKM